MLENISPHIACDFYVSQELWNANRGCKASQRVAGPYHVVCLASTISLETVSR